MLYFRQGVSVLAVMEKAALWRVLCASRRIYSALAEGTAENGADMLDSISAALSHCLNERKPLSRCLGQLKKELKRADRELYRTIKPCFSRLSPAMDYDFDKAARHIPAIIYGNDMLCAKLMGGEKGKARSMADAMKSYPGFLFGEFEALSDAQFYDLVFGFYPKLYEEPFMEEMQEMFR